MTQWGLDNLFNPGKRHMDDEKRRLQATREEVGDSSGGRRIDLDSGTVAISLTGRPASSRQSDRQQPAESPEPDGGAPADEDALTPDHAATEQPAVRPEPAPEPGPAPEPRPAPEPGPAPQRGPAPEPDQPPASRSGPPSTPDRARNSAAAWARRG